MSYHRFTNLREIFHKDLSRKMNLDIESEDFKTRDCNCRGGTCSYNNLCRQTCIVYKVQCKLTNKIYIGTTQQFLKTRMQQHQTEVRALQRTGRKYDSYARHFASQLRNFNPITPRLVRNTSILSIVWKANPITAVKTFGTPQCVLCNRERLEILKMTRTHPDLLINSCNEIYGACRHKAKFHRYIQAVDQH